MGFAHISVDEKSQAEICSFEESKAILCVLDHLQSDDPLCQKYGALTIGNIAANLSHCGILTHLGSIEKLMNLAAPSTSTKGTTTLPEVVSVCVYALANLAVSSDHHGLFVPYVESIVSWTSSSRKDTQKYGALLLRNLAVEETMGLHLVQNGGLKGLLNLLTSRSPVSEAKFHAFSALQSLLLDDDAKMTMMKTGVLQRFGKSIHALIAFIEMVDNESLDDPAVVGSTEMKATMRQMRKSSFINDDLTRPSASRILVELIATFSIISISNKTHPFLVEASVIHAVFKCARFEASPEAQTFAVTTIANLTVNLNTHLTLTSSNAPSLLCTLSTTRDGGVKEAVMRGIANLCAAPKQHLQLMENDVFNIFVHCLNESDLMCMLYASLGCVMMSENLSMMTHMNTGNLIEALFSAAYNTTRTTTSGGLNEQEVEKIATKITKYSILALANISSNRESHFHMGKEIRSRGAAKLFSLTIHQDTGIQKYFTLLVANLAAEERSHKVLDTNVSIEHVTNMLRSKDKETVRNTLHFIHGVIAPSTRERISEVVLGHLLDLVGELTTDKDQLLVLDILEGLAQSDYCKRQMFKEFPEKTFHVLEAFSMVPRLELKRKSIQLIATLAELPSLHENLLSHDFRNILMQCRESTDPTIEAAVLRTFCNMCANANMVDEMNNMGIIAMLTESCSSPHSLCRKFAFTGIGNLASHPRATIDLRKLNILPHFMELSASESTNEGFFKSRFDIEEKRACMFAIANCLSHESNHVYVSASAALVIKNLFRVMAGGDMLLQRHGALLLSNMAAGLYEHPVFSDKYVLSLILKMARTSRDPLTRAHTLSCTRSISLAEGNVAALMECNVATFMYDHLAIMDVIFAMLQDESDDDSDDSDAEDSRGAHRKKFFGRQAHNEAAAIFKAGGVNEMRMAREYCSLVYNLSAYESIAVALIKCGITYGLIRLLKCGDRWSQNQIACSLSNFALHEKTRHSLLDLDCAGVCGLLDALNQAYVHIGVVDSSSSKATSGDDVSSNRNSTGVDEETIVGRSSLTGTDVLEGVMEIVVSGKGAHSSSEVSYEMLHNATAVAFGFLMENEQSRQTILATIGTARLLQYIHGMVRHNNQNVRTAGLWGLAACTNQPSSKMLNEENSELPFLLPMLAKIIIDDKEDENSDVSLANVRKNSLRVICNLSINPRYHEHILQHCETIVRNLHKFFIRSDYEQKRLLIAFLSNLSANPDNHFFLAGTLDIRRIGELLLENDSTVQLYLVKTFVDLIASENNAKAIIQQGHIISMLAGEYSTHLTQAKYAIRSDARRGKRRGHTRFESTAELGNGVSDEELQIAHRMQLYVAQAIHNSTHHRQFFSELVSQGVLEGLTALANVKTEEVQYAVVCSFVLLVTPASYVKLINHLDDSPSNSPRHYQQVFNQAQEKWRQYQEEKLLGAFRSKRSSRTADDGKEDGGNEASGPDGSPSPAAPSNIKEPTEATVAQQLTAIGEEEDGDDNSWRPSEDDVVDDMDVEEVGDEVLLTEDEKVARSVLQRVLNSDETIAAVLAMIQSKQFPVYSQSFHLLSNMFLFHPASVGSFANRAIVDCTVRVALTHLKVLEKYNVVRTRLLHRVHFGLAGNAEEEGEDPHDNLHTRDRRKKRVELAASLTIMYHCAVVLRGFTSIPDFHEDLIAAGVIPILFQFCGARTHRLLPHRMYSDMVERMQELGTTALHAMMKDDRGIQACLNPKYSHNSTSVFIRPADKESEKSLVVDALLDVLSSGVIHLQESAARALCHVVEQNHSEFIAMFVQRKGFSVILDTAHEVFVGCLPQESEEEDEAQSIIIEDEDASFACSIMSYALRLASVLASLDEHRELVAHFETTSVFVFAAKSLLYPHINSPLFMRDSEYKEDQPEDETDPEEMFNSPVVQHCEDLYALIAEIFAKLVSSDLSFDIVAHQFLGVAVENLVSSNPVIRSLSLITMCGPSRFGHSHLFEQCPNAMYLLHELHDFPDDIKSLRCARHVSVSISLLKENPANYPFMFRYYYGTLSDVSGEGEEDESSDNDSVMTDMSDRITVNPAKAWGRHDSISSNGKLNFLLNAGEREKGGDRPWNIISILFDLVDSTDALIKKNALVDLQTMTCIGAKKEFVPRCLCPPLVEQPKKGSKKKSTTAKAAAAAGGSTVVGGPQYHGLCTVCGVEVVSVIRREHLDVLVQIVSQTRRVVNDSVEESSKMGPAGSKSRVTARATAKRKTIMFSPMRPGFQSLRTPSSETSHNLSPLPQGTHLSFSQDMESLVALSLSTLCNIFAVRLNHSIVSQTTAVPTITALLSVMSENEAISTWIAQVHKYAITALCNLSSNTANHTTLQSAGSLGGISTILDFIQVSSRLDQRVASLVVSNMCSTYLPEHANNAGRNLFDVISLGNTTRLVDIHSARNLALAMCKLTSHARFEFETHVTLDMSQARQGPGARSNARRTRKSRTPTNGRSARTASKQDDFEQAVPVFLSGLLRLNESVDNKTREYAFMTLVNLIVKVKSLSHIFSGKRLIEVFLKIMKNQDAATLLLALRCLLRLLSLEENRKYITETQEFNRLVSLSFHANQQIRTEVAQNLNRILTPPTVTDIPYGAIVLSALCQLALSPENEARCEGMEGFFRYLQYDVNRNVLHDVARSNSAQNVSTFGSVLKVFHSVLSKAEEEQHAEHYSQALVLLKLLSEMPGVSVKLSSAGTLQMLTYCITNGYMTPNEDAGQILLNMSLDNQTHPRFYEMRGVECLMCFLSCDAASVDDTGVLNMKLMGVEALSNICPYLANKLSQVDRDLKATIIEALNAEMSCPSASRRLVHLCLLCHIQLGTEQYSRHYMLENGVLESVYVLWKKSLSPDTLIAKKNKTVSPVLDIELSCIVLIAKLAADLNRGEEVCLFLSRKEVMDSLLSRCVQTFGDKSRANTMRASYTFRLSDALKDSNSRPSTAEFGERGLGKHGEAYEGDRKHDEAKAGGGELDQSELTPATLIQLRLVRLFAVMAMQRTIRLRLVSLGVAGIIIKMRSAPYKPLRQLAISTLYTIFENQNALDLYMETDPHLKTKIAAIQRAEADVDIEAQSQLIRDRMDLILRARKKEGPLTTATLANRFYDHP